MKLTEGSRELISGIGPMVYLEWQGIEVVQQAAVSNLQELQVPRPKRYQRKKVNRIQIIERKRAV